MSATTPNDKDPKFVLITGAAQRIGRAITLEFVHAGWQVGIHCHSSVQPAEELAGEIESLGGKAAIFKADLADPHQLENLIGNCTRMFGPLDCLVNNASLFEKDELHSLDHEGWQAHMNINLRAPVFLAQLFARALPEGKDGCVINIVDQRVKRPEPDFFSYSVSKAGLWWATKTMAQALAPHIRVNAVSPGPTLQSIHQDQEEFSAEERATLLQRGVTPQQIAEAVRFLVEAPSITGQMICVDSGQHLRAP